MKRIVIIILIFCFGMILLSGCSNYQNKQVYDGEIEWLIRRGDNSYHIKVKNQAREYIIDVDELVIDYDSSISAPRIIILEGRDLGAVTYHAILKVRDRKQRDEVIKFK